jgi:transcriptional regulator
LSVYIPRVFEPPDLEPVARLAAEHPFGVLITPAGDEPQVTHLPLEYVPGAGPRGTLLGHIARANPHWRHFGEGPSVAIFQGPHSYVSPSWYAEPAAAVPTWNYAVAHLHGRAELMDGENEKRELLERMVERYERGRAQPWRLQLQGRALEAMLGAIVGFRLAVERVEVKLKLSQNRSPDDRERVIAALAAEDAPDATATARWMEAYARER